MTCATKSVAVIPCDVLSSVTGESCDERIPIGARTREGAEFQVERHKTTVLLAGGRARSFGSITPASWDRPAVITEQLPAAPLSEGFSIAQVVRESEERSDDFFIPIGDRPRVRPQRDEATIDIECEQVIASRLSGVHRYTSVEDHGHGVKAYTTVLSGGRRILQGMPRRCVTDSPFAEELPRLLEAQGLTLRALAREVGGLDHAYLSRMIRGQVPTNVEHVRRIARRLGLSDDYFPEVREAAVVAAIRDRPRLRDEVYFGRVKRVRK